MWRGIRSDVKDGVVPMLSVARTTLTQAVTFVALIAALLIISWRAFLVLMAIIPIATTVSVLVGRRIRELTVVERDREAELVSLLTRAVSAFKMVCTFGLGPRTVQAHDRSLREVLDSTYQRFRVVRTLQGASDLTMVISDVCSIFVGALFVFRQQMTLGSFIAFMNAFWRSATTLIGIFKKHCRDAQPRCGGGAGGGVHDRAGSRGVGHAHRGWSAGRRRSATGTAPLPCFRISPWPFHPVNVHW